MEIIKVFATLTRLFNTIIFLLLYELSILVLMKCKYRKETNTYSFCNLLNKLQYMGIFIFQTHLLFKVIGNNDDENTVCKFCRVNKEIFMCN